MLELMQKQMEQMLKLQAENLRLRASDGTAPTTKKTRTPDRPTIDANIDEREWELFKDSWRRYKTMTGLTTPDNIRMELRAACSKDVNRLLFEFVGATTLDTTTEDDLLTHIRSVAVKGTHKEVHRMYFSKLTQMEGETITQFVARLKSQAALCQFNIACTDHDPPVRISFADEMVTQRLIAGLRNEQHQSRVLAEAGTLTTLVAKIERLQCLESTEESTTRMRDPPTGHTSKADVARLSAHRRSNRPPTTRDYKTIHKPPTTGSCRGCGRQTHGNGKSMARKDCPAYSKACGHCGITGHFKAVCSRLEEENKSRANVATSQDETPDGYEADPLYDNQSFAFASTQRQGFRPTHKTIGHP